MNTKHFCICCGLSKNRCSPSYDSMRKPDGYPISIPPLYTEFSGQEYFGIEKTSQLIRRLKGKANLRLLCGFTDVPGKASFSKVIDEFIRNHGHIPIIDPNKRKDNDRPPLDRAKKERYNIRTTVERTNSHLKDSLIPRSIYMKGYKKVSFVLMTTVICLAALKYLQLFI
jgi:hypothetical protein